MQGATTAGLVWNLMRPRYLRAIPEKMASRTSHLLHARVAQDARQWSADRAIPVEEFMECVNGELADEARDLGMQLRVRAEQLRAEGRLVYRTQGDAALAYFLVRYCRPVTVVETGVAAGFSSVAILTALEKNGDGGRLWSSDLPYVWVRGSEKLVGTLVTLEYRARWRLFLEGDRRNLRAIARRCGPISLFHYDSDKSYFGRRRALREVKRALDENAVLVFDDIEDNFHFRDLATRMERVFFVLRSGEGKYVGVIADRRITLGAPRQEDGRQTAGAGEPSSASAT